MTKQELIARLREQAALANLDQAKSAVDALTAIISEVLAAGDTVTLPGFGTFKVSKRASRKGRNPHTGEQIDIPACKSVKFTPASALKSSLN